MSRDLKMTCNGGNLYLKMGNRTLSDIYLFASLFNEEVRPCLPKYWKYRIINPAEQSAFLTRWGMLRVMKRRHVATTVFLVWHTRFCTPIEFCCGDKNLSPQHVAWLIQQSHEAGTKWSQFSMLRRAHCSCQLYQLQNSHESIKTHHWNLFLGALSDFCDSYASIRWGCTVGLATCVLCSSPTKGLVPVICSFVCVDLYCLLCFFYRCDLLNRFTRIQYLCIPLILVEIYKVFSPKYSACLMIYIFQAYQWNS